ncbi:MAG: hypothetical protein ACWA47_13330 [Brevirhabdus sp.]
MFRIIKGLFLLAILAFIGLTGFAFLGDLSPHKAEITQDVEINVD